MLKQWYFYKKAELTDENNSIFKLVFKFPFYYSRYCYERRKMTYDNIVKIMISFQNIFKTSRYSGMLKKRPGNSSVRKLELIRSSSPLQVNIINIHLLTQEKPQFVVENYYADKQVALFKEQYSLLIHKT